MEKDTNVIFRINSTLKENVTNLAKERGVTLSDVLTACLKDIEHRKMIPINVQKYLPPKYAKQNTITIALIKRCLDEIIEKNAKGHVKKVYLFGSFARGDEKPSSDIDLRFEVTDDFSLIEHSNIRLDLKEAFHRDVDIVTGNPEELDTFFINTIRKEEICLYEKQRSAS